MHDLTPFERRLSDRLAAELASSVRPFDSQAIAAAAIGRRRTTYHRRSVVLLVAAAAVLVALIAGVILVGSGVLNPRLLAPKDPHLPWPLTGVVEPAGSLSLSEGSSAVLLTDGRVFVLGYDTDGRSAQTWDPKTGTATPTGPMVRARTPWSMVRLGDGRVLLTGGDETVGGESTAEIFDPATGTFSLIASRPSTVESSAVLLRDGRVLLSGGFTTLDPDLNGNREVSYQAEIFDPATSTFSPTPPMHRRRTGHTMQLLSDGRVLLFGGSVNSSRAPEQGQASVEVFDPATGQFDEPRGQIVVNEVFDRWAMLSDNRVVLLRQPGWGQYPARSLPMMLDEYNPATGVEKVGPTIPASAPVYDVLALVRLTDSRVLLYGFDKASAFSTTVGNIGGKGWIGVLDVDSGELFQIAVRDTSWATVVPSAGGRVLFIGGRQETPCPYDEGGTQVCSDPSTTVDAVR